MGFQTLTFRRVFIAFVALLVFIILLQLLLCDDTLITKIFMNEGYIPKRPAQVPYSAVWAGGVDGGVWIECTCIDDRNNVISCTIYFENTGDIWYKGDYYLEESVICSDTLKHLFTAFDGYYLHLRNGNKLTPVDYPDSMAYNDIDKFKP